MAMYKLSLGHLFSILLTPYPEVESLGRMIILFQLLRSHQTVSPGGRPSLRSHQQYRLQALHTLANTCSPLLTTVILLAGRWYLTHCCSTEGLPSSHRSGPQRPLGWVRAAWKQRPSAARLESPAVLGGPTSIQELKTLSGGVWGAEGKAGPWGAGAQGQGQCLHLREHEGEQPIVTAGSGVQF